MSDKDSNPEIDLDGTADDPTAEEASEAAPVDPIEALTTERDDLLARLQRVSADYLNYQKRAERERADSRDFIVGDVISSILDVMDDLELVIGHARQNHPADDPLLVGAEMVRNKANEAFKRFGVEPIVADGEMFDPALHEAIGTQPSDDVEPMTILAEARKGYTLKNRTLRPSRVLVAQAVETNDNADDQADE